MKQNIPRKAKRNLVYFPIVHTPEDLGRLKEFVRKEALKRGGLQSAKRKAVFIDRLWTEIEEAIGKMGLDFENTVVFQDTLPVCGNEKKIVEELAGGGSRNHGLLLKLLRKGAVLAGTESPELLVEEYESMKQLMEGKKSAGADFGADLLERRDRFIAERIDRVLKEGETGLLFMGILHNVERYLPDDIETVYPLYRPMQGARPGEKNKP